MTRSRVGNISRSAGRCQHRHFNAESAENAEVLFLKAPREAPALSRRTARALPRQAPQEIALAFSATSACSALDDLLLFRVPGSLFRVPQSRAVRQSEIGIRKLEIPGWVPGFNRQWSIVNCQSKPPLFTCQIARRAPEARPPYYPRASAFARAKA